MLSQHSKQEGEKLMLDCKIKECKKMPWHNTQTQKFDGVHKGAERLSEISILIITAPKESCFYTH